MLATGYKFLRAANDPARRALHKLSSPSGQLLKGKYLAAIVY